jgi:hypothetical protein
MRRKTVASVSDFFPRMVTSAGWVIARGWPQWFTPPVSQSNHLSIVSCNDCHSICHCKTAGRSWTRWHGETSDNLPVCLWSPHANTIPSLCLYPAWTNIGLSYTSCPLFY